jgi:hypothetical protein
MGPGRRPMEVENRGRAPASNTPPRLSQVGGYSLASRGFPRPRPRPPHRPSERGARGRDRRQTLL